MLNMGYLINKDIPKGVHLPDLDSEAFDVKEFYHTYNVPH